MNEHRQTIIVGTQKEFNEVLDLMQNAGMEERVLGRVDVDGVGETKAIGNIEELHQLVKNVFCKRNNFLRRTNCLLKK